MKYFSIVLMISLFVVLYVWQNIEIMKMKMEYRKLIRTERELKGINDKLKFEYEKLRSFGNMESSADRIGLRQIGPADLVVIRIEDEKKVKNEDK